LRSPQVVRLIIFDLGGVVFTHSFDCALRLWADRGGARFEDIKTRYSHDEMYALHEVGRIGIAEYRDHVCRELGLVLGLEDFIEGWNAIFLEEIPGVTELLGTLGREYPVVALSNTNHTHCQVMRQKYSAPLSQFQKVYFSHEIGERKPDPGAYEKVLADFGVTGSQGLFLDDLPVNLEGAQRLGLQTIHVKNFDAMVAGLREKGLLDT